MVWVGFPSVADLFSRRQPGKRNLGSFLRLRSEQTHSSSLCLEMFTPSKRAIIKCLVLQFAI